MKTRRYFTVIELLVVMAVVMVIFSIMCHTFVRAKEIARRAYCLNNLKQISTLANLYNVDRGSTPYSSNWLVDLSFCSDYLQTYAVLECPSMDDHVKTPADLNGNTSYHYMGSREDWLRNNIANGDGTEYGFDSSNPAIQNLLSNRSEKLVYDKTNNVHAGLFNIVNIETSNAEIASGYETNNYWFVAESGSLNFPEGMAVTSNASSTAVTVASSTVPGDGNNGHGNNADGVDSSNPGNSKTGQDSNPAVDDESTTATTTTTTVASTDTGKNNNGHGNNADGVDVSNPGQGKGGPNGTVDASGTVDDETKGGTATTTTTTTTTTATTTPATTTTTTDTKTNNGKKK